MGNAAEVRRMTAAEFLAWEERQTLRHEFFDGEVFEMPGSEDRHGSVVLNLAIALRQALRGTACRVYAQEIKLFVAAVQQYFYPDVFVTCSAADAQSRLIKSEPRFIAEVLSPSTAAFDRGDRFASYRKLPTLEEYLLVDIDSRRADLFRKGADGLWVLHPLDAGGALTLALGCTIVADELFADLEA